MTGRRRMSQNVWFIVETDEDDGRDEEAERELDRIRQMIEAGHYDDPDVGLPLGWEGVEPVE